MTLLDQNKVTSVIFYFETFSITRYIVIFFILFVSLLITIYHFFRNSLDILTKTD